MQTAQQKTDNEAEIDQAFDDMLNAKTRDQAVEAQNKMIEHIKQRDTITIAGMEHAMGLR